MEEVAVHYSHKVLIEVDEKISLIVDDPHEIFDRPRPICLLNITIILISYLLLIIKKQQWLTHLGCLGLCDTRDLYQGTLTEGEGSV